MVQIISMQIFIRLLYSYFDLPAYFKAWYLFLLGMSDLGYNNWIYFQGLISYTPAYCSTVIHTNCCYSRLKTINKTANVCVQVTLTYRLQAIWLGIINWEYKPPEGDLHHWMINIFSRFQLWFIHFFFKFLSHIFKSFIK